MKKSLLFLGLTLATSAASAVDGYQTLTFGMSQEEAKATGICTLKEQDLGVAAIEGLVCDDLQHAGAAHKAYVLFLDNALARVVIEQEAGATRSQLLDLREKYGAPSTEPTEEQWQAVKEASGTVNFGFDDDTVILKSNVDNKQKETLALIYTTPDYEQKLAELQKAP